MRKFIVILLQIFIVASMFCTSVNAATSATIKVTPTSKEVSRGEKIEVVLSLENVDSTKKVESVEGYINYDKTVIEDITVNSIHQTNGKVQIGSEELRVEDLTNANNNVSTADSFVAFNGNPASENDSKLLIDFSNGMTSNVDLVTIDFYVKADAPLGAKTSAISYSMFVITEDSVASEEITKNIDLTVKEAPPPEVVKLSSIKVTTPPTKTTYTAGENFDATGMVVTATYTNNTTREVTGYTVTPSSALTTSNSSVTITYTEGDVTKTATQSITVKSSGGNTSKTLSSITVSNTPTKTSYKEGERFDTSGMVIRANYSDGTNSNVTGYTVTPSGTLTTSDRSVTISYTENGVTRSVTQSINVTANTVNNTVTNQTSNTTKNTTNSNRTNTDNTTAGTKIPATGAKMIFIPLVLLAVVTYISYDKYVKYKGV